MADAPITFGAWEPDKAPHMSPSLVEAINVLPVAGAYAPFPAHVPVSGTTLDSYAYGLFAAPLSSGTPVVYAATKDEIYRLLSGTKRLMYDAGSITPANWWMTSFEGRIIAGNSSVAPVAGEPNVVMTALGGNPPAAAVGGVVERNFLFLGNLTEDGVDGYCPNRVRWSGFRNADAWGTNVGTQADYEDMVDEGGPVVAFAGRETGTVFQRKAITRAQYVGGSSVFDFTTVELGRGAIAGGAVCDIGNASFFIADDGFFAWDGTQAIPVGTNKVDRWFNETVEHTALDRIVSGYDPVSRCVLWGFPEAGYTTPTRLIAYSLADQRWTSIAVPVQQLAASASLPTALEDMPIPDSMGSASFDDPAYAGKRPVLSGVNGSNAYGTFSGSSLAATLTTGDWQSAPGQRSFINGVRPLIDAATAKIALGERPQTSHEVLTWQPATSQGVDGLCPQRLDARYIRHKLMTDAGDTWTRATGLEVSKIKSGGRR